MENMFFWILGGVVAGWLAKRLVPGEAPGGMVTDFIVGIVGAMAGGFLFFTLVGYNYGGWMVSIASALVGAVVLLCALRLINCSRISPR